MVLKSMEDPLSMGNNQYCQLEECQEIEWNENRSNLGWIDSLKL